MLKLRLFSFFPIQISIEQKCEGALLVLHRLERHKYFHEGHSVGQTAHSASAGFKTNAKKMQITTKCHNGQRTTARGYSESQGQAAVENQGERMFNITVSDLFYVLETFASLFCGWKVPSNSVRQCRHVNHWYFVVLLTIQNYPNYVISA